MTTPEHHRRSIRLPEYDYSSPGAYFVTIVAFQQVHLFGEIVDGKMHVNDLGQIVYEEWHRTLTIRVEMELGAFQVMPNHIHGILVIHEVNPPVGAHGRAPLHDEPVKLVRKPRSLGSYIAGFKSITTKRINQARNTPGMPVWQRNYYEHIIRDEDEWQQIHAYIQTNPVNWLLDEEYALPGG